MVCALSALLRPSPSQYPDNKENGGGERYCAATADDGIHVVPAAPELQRVPAVPDADKQRQHEADDQNRTRQQRLNGLHELSLPHRNGKLRPVPPRRPPPPRLFAGRPRPALLGSPHPHLPRRNRHPRFAHHHHLRARRRAPRQSRRAHAGSLSSRPARAHRVRADHPSLTTAARFSAGGGGGRRGRSSPAAGGPRRERGSA